MGQNSHWMGRGKINMYNQCEKGCAGIIPLKGLTVCYTLNTDNSCPCVNCIIKMMCKDTCEESHKWARRISKKKGLKEYKFANTT